MTKEERIYNEETASSKSGAGETTDRYKKI